MTARRPVRTRAGAVVALAAAALLAVAGCAPSPGTAGGAAAAQPPATSYPDPAGRPGAAAPATRPDPAAVARAGLDPCVQPDADADADAAADADAGAGAVPGGLPAVSLPCLGEGPDVALGSLRGTPTVVNVWAQWCGPCRRELPHLQALHERAGDRVRVLGLNFRDPAPDGALELLAATGVTFPSVVDAGGELTAPLRLSALPQTLFVAADGRVVHRKAGPVRSADELVALVEEHLGVRL